MNVHVAVVLVLSNVPRFVCYRSAVYLHVGGS